MIRRILLSLALLLSLFVPVLAQDGPLWLRYPALSPDGAWIVFSFEGDLYRVASAGGTAVPLTVSDAYDFQAVYSHDGATIAFASNRYGNFDVFRMPSSGGEATRLTFYSADDFPSDFTPDDSAVVFTSARLDAAANTQFPSGALPELYSVPVGAGRPSQVLTTPAGNARFTGDGTSFTYHDLKSVENPWRKHQTSSVASDLWLYDPAAGAHRRLTATAYDERDPLVRGGSLYFLSEESGTFNVRRSTLADPSSSEALTRFEKHPVRFLTASADGALLCFSWDGEIYTLTPGGEPRKVSVEVATDPRSHQKSLLAVSGDIAEMALSPNGKEVAFVFRGEVFAASVGEGTTRRVTSTPGQERSVSFSPDGRSLLYAAERDGSWQIYRTSLARESEKYFFNATLLREEPLLESEAETFQPSYSPDGKEVAYLENGTTLKVLNLESHKTRTVLPGHLSFSYADGDQRYDWSPDSRWLFVQFLQPGVYSPEIGLVSAGGSGEVKNLTESGFADLAPRWMMKGEMMMWLSNRDGLRSQARTGPTEVDVYAQFLTRKAYDRFRLSKEEFELLESEEAKEKEGKKEEKDEKSDDKKEEVEPLRIELEGLRDRRVRLTIHSSQLASAVVTPKGDTLLYLTRFEKGFDLWSTDLRTHETKVLAKLGSRSAGDLVLDEKGENVFFLADGRITKVEVASGKQEGVAVNGEMWVDRQGEFAYFFEHVWRQVKRKFYDPGLHGADWDFYKTAYARFLPYIDTTYDFIEMLSELLGELNASHTGARFRGQGEEGDDTSSLGLFFDPTYAGDGLKVAEVLAKGPVVRDESRIRPGVVVEKIDGTSIRAGMNYFPLLSRKAGKNVLLSLFDEASGERFDEVIKPIGAGEERQLLYERWVEGRRRATEELSGGRIGYVHVRSMSDGSFRTVYEEALGRNATKEALVVDTRFNTGGDLVDDLSIFLSGKKYMEFVPPRGGVVGVEPGARWTRPSIVLASEGNYSDAHCFPWAYQTLGIGKVVGMPVAGTCTFVWWEMLQDRQIVFGIPNMAVTSTDGKPLENLQLVPDIRVENDYEAVAAGRDPQLERAVAELLKELD